MRLADDPFDEEEPPSSEKLEIETRIALDDVRALRQLARLGELTSSRCPDCHRSLWQFREDEFIRFRCRTGHAYTVEALLAKQGQALENILRNAFRSASEKATLAPHLAKQARQINNKRTSQWESQLREAEQRAQLIQQVLSQGAT